jgi:hypothetical protein
VSADLGRSRLASNAVQTHSLSRRLFAPHPSNSFRSGSEAGSEKSTAPAFRADEARAWSGGPFVGGHMNIMIT